MRPLFTVLDSTLFFFAMAFRISFNSCSIIVIGRVRRRKRRNLKNGDRILKSKEDGWFLRGIRVREYATSCKNKQSSSIIRLRHVQRSHDEYLVFTRKNTHFHFFFILQKVGVRVRNNSLGANFTS